MLLSPDNVARVFQWLCDERAASVFGAALVNESLENHGVVTCGDTLQQAFRRFETFEFLDFDERVRPLVSFLEQLVEQECVPQ